MIEDDPDISSVMKEALAWVKGTAFDCECSGQLSTGLQRLQRGGIDLVLLDLLLPDSQGFDTYLKVHEQVPTIPIVVMTGLDDETLALKAVQEGAQDYIVKGQVNRNVLIRALRYAIERHGLQEELRSLSLVDDLTGLHNRRGFLTLAQQQMKVADRSKRAMLLLFSDLDRMKWINDTFGHREGDAALNGAAKVLKETFRDSDIIARLGGDEFAVLAIEYSPLDDRVVMGRLNKSIELYNTKTDRHYKLSFSVGTALYDPNNPSSLDELMARADESMYAQKRSRRP